MHRRALSPRVVTAALTAAAAWLAASSLVLGQEHDHGQGRDREHEHEHEHPAMGGRMNVFISPAGEPFRAPAGQPYPVEAWFNQADANHDGVITEDEFVNDATAFFHKLDVNGDGVIDGFEVDDYEQKIAPEILPRVGGLTSRDMTPLPSNNPDEQRRRELEAAQDQQQEAAKSYRGGPVYDGAAVFGLIREPEPVAAADLDFDGKITLQEWIATARRHFEELDLDHDGRLTLAELPRTPVEKLEDKAKRKREGH